MLRHNLAVAGVRLAEQLAQVASAAGDARRSAEILAQAGATADAAAEQARRANALSPDLAAAHLVRAVALHRRGVFAHQLGDAAAALAAYHEASVALGQGRAGAAWHVTPGLEQDARDLERTLARNAALAEAALSRAVDSP